ncbi:hypothetical protein LJC46_02085 [Desulfovibrio sp. OttesenSCG-928-G15]|nr:hypothetical protein [Desulfovibrio sp. OttesenSCG-928-G15]
MAEMKIKATLEADDKLSAQAGAALDSVAAKSKEVEKASASAGKAGAQAGQSFGKAGAHAQKVMQAQANTATNLGKATTAAHVASARAAKDAGRAGEQAGKATARAAKDAGTALQGTAKAAKEAGREDMARARRGLRGVTEEGRRAGREVSRLKSAMGTIGKGVGLAGGVAMGGTAALMTIGNPIAYEANRANIANRLYHKRDLEGRKAGMGEVDKMITDAASNGRGTRDSATSAAHVLAYGGVSADKMAQVLPAVTGAATATGTDSALVAKFAAGISQKGFAPDQINRVLDMAHAAAAQGGMTYGDTLTALSSVLSKDNATDMRSVGDMLSAIMRGSQGTGDASGAATGAKALNTAILSNGVRNSLKKNYRVDRDKSITTAAAEHGQGSIEAFGNIVHSQLDKDKEYQKLSKQLQGAEGAQKDNLLKAMEARLTAVLTKMGLSGEALDAARATYGGDWEGYKRGAKALQNSDGSVDKDLALNRESLKNKAEQAQNAVLNALQQQFEKLSPVLGTVLDGVTGLATALPELTAAVVLTAAGIGAVAGGRMLFGGKAGPARDRAMRGKAKPTASSTPGGKATPSVALPASRPAYDIRPGRPDAKNTPRGKVFAELNAVHTGRRPGAHFAAQYGTPTHPALVTGKPSLAGLQVAASTPASTIIPGKATPAPQNTTGKGKAAIVVTAGTLLAGAANASDGSGSDALKSLGIDAASWGGAAIGGKAGATAGATFGPLGAALGGLIGSILGMTVGAKAAEEALDAIANGAPDLGPNLSRRQMEQGLVPLPGPAATPPPPEVTVEPTPVNPTPVENNIDLKNHIVVQIDGRQVAAIIGERVYTDSFRGMRP